MEDNKPVLSNGITLRATQYVVDSDNKYGYPGGWETQMQALSYTGTVGPVDIWKTPSTRWMSIKQKKASWPIYNHKLEDKNSYSNGIHEKQIAGRSRIRGVMRQCKIK